MHRARCDEEMVPDGTGIPSDVGLLCNVCADAIANPIEPPVGLAGRVSRALRRLFVKPCDERGEYVCAHRSRVS